jgi:hypothetical protein
MATAPTSVCHLSQTAEQQIHKFCQIEEFDHKTSLSADDEYCENLTVVRPSILIVMMS